MANYTKTAQPARIPPEDLPVLTSRDAKSWLGISQSTFGRLIKTGLLQGTKIGNQWRFTEDAIRAVYRTPAA